MSAKLVVQRVMRNAGSMANRGLPVWKSYFGGPHAVARMKRGLKKAASSARRRLEKMIIGEVDHQED